MVRVALTGTPGVGKTTLAKLAAAKGWRVVDVKAWAKEQGCVVARDETDQADVIDVKRLARKVPKDDGSNVLYEGHLSHLLGVDEAWVVRCDPKVLRKRLKARRYKAAKILENLEAEALDLILQEALDAVPRVLQRDGTTRSPEALLRSFLNPSPKRGHDLDAVDWSDQLPFQ